MTTRSIAIDFAILFSLRKKRILDLNMRSLSIFVFSFPCLLFLKSYSLGGTAWNNIIYVVSICILWHNKNNTDIAFIFEVICNVRLVESNPCRQYVKVKIQSLVHVVTALNCTQNKYLYIIVPLWDGGQPKTRLLFPSSFSVKVMTVNPNVWRQVQNYKGISSVTFFQGRVVQWSHNTKCRHGNERAGLQSEPIIHTRVPIPKGRQAVKLGVEPKLIYLLKECTSGQLQLYFQHSCIV